MTVSDSIITPLTDCSVNLSRCLFTATVRWRNDNKVWWIRGIGEISAIWHDRAVIHSGIRIVSIRRIAAGG